MTMKLGLRAIIAAAGRRHYEKRIEKKETTRAVPKTGYRTSEKREFHPPRYELPDGTLSPRCTQGEVHAGVPNSIRKKFGWAER